MLMGLGPRTVRQGSLFGAAKPSDHAARTMAVLDAVNRRYGRDTVWLGSAGIEQRWAMKADNRSKKFTTCWRELPTANAN